MNYSELYIQILRLKNYMEKTERGLLSSHGLTRNDTLVLSVIDAAGKTLGELCSLCCIDKSTMTKITKKLEKEGYIEKATNCLRGYKIYLTEQGNLLNDKTYEAFSKLQSAQSEFLSEEEITLLGKLLDKLFRISEQTMTNEIVKMIHGEQ